LAFARHLKNSAVFSKESQRASALCSSDDEMNEVHPDDARQAAMASRRPKNRVIPFHSLFLRGRSDGVGSMASSPKTSVVLVPLYVQQSFGHLLPSCAGFR